MKHIFYIVVLVGGILTSTHAQPPNFAACKEKMLPLLQWVGTWKGEGSMLSPSGEKKSSVVEKIEAKLDNTMIMLEGIGKITDPATQQETVVHHAIGVVSFDAVTSQYKLRTWLQDGKSGDSWFKITGENSYQWGFENPMGKTRYTIELNPQKKTWFEFGEFSKDGTTWKKFFEMNLTKVD